MKHRLYNIKPTKLVGFIVYRKRGNHFLIYRNMKAKEVLEKYKITRRILSNWVKRGWIKVEVLPSGRYLYFDKEKN